MSTTRKIKKKIEISSENKYIKKVSHEILGYLQDFGINKSVQFDVRLAVEEAVRNSIEHGHFYEEKLPITVLYSVDSDKVTIEVADKGDGFDVKKIPDPRNVDNLMKGGGRGVFLIYKLMDRVRYNKKGNKVSMTKFFK